MSYAIGRKNKQKDVFNRLFHKQKSFNFNIRQEYRPVRKKVDKIHFKPQMGEEKGTKPRFLTASLTTNKENVKLTTECPKSGITEIFYKS
jgi:hypothetical protein